VYAGLSVLPGNAHECPVLYQLVENFVSVVGQGVLKLLILDRGFIDGKNISRCKAEWKVDVLITIKKNMDIWTDAWALGKTQPWQPLPSPAPPSPSPAPQRPQPLVRRDRIRQQT